MLWARFLFVFSIASGLLIAVCGEQPPRVLNRSPGKKWAHNAFKNLDAGLRKGAERFLHLRGQRELGIPIEIDIILVGFDGEGAYEYAMNAGKLESLLQTNYPTRHPVSRETGKPLSSKYHIVYNVVTAPKEDIGQIESALKVGMTRGGMLNLEAAEILWGFDAEPIPTYNVEATKIEPVIDGIVARVFGMKNFNVKSPEWQKNMAVVVINPSKRRIHPDPPPVNATENVKLFSTKDWDSGVFDTDAMLREEGKYVYQYEYNGAGKSNVWIAENNYLVIDVSSGPCKFGPKLSPSGAVTPLSLPRIMDVLYEGATSLTLHNPIDLQGGVMEDIASARDAIFRGKIAAVLVSAIQHVFLPDVWVDNVHDMRRLVVPIMFIRNHLEFDPYDPNGKHFINVTDIHEEVFTMMGVRDRAVVTHSLHSLHEHRQLAVALHKAISSKSEAAYLDVVTPEGKPGLHANLRSYLDGDVLLDDFEHAADVLTAGWVGQVKNDASLWGQTRTSGATRVLPVYILSLKDADFDLAMENRALFAADGRAVIVLQTVSTFADPGADSVDTGHFCQGERVTMSTVDIQRHIVAGIATALMGVTPPYESYSAYRKDHILEDWMWAAGHTPHGPYSNTTTLSGLTVNAARRNMLLARIENVLKSLRKAMDMVDEFIAEYMHEPFVELNVKPGEMAMGGKTWLDYMYSSPSQSQEPPLPKDVAANLQNLLNTMEGALNELSRLMFDGQYDRMDATLNTINNALRNFEERVEIEVDDARERLRCCEVVHELPQPPSRAWLYVGLLVFVVCAWVVVSTFCIRENHEPPLGLTNRMYA